MKIFLVMFFFIFNFTEVNYEQTTISNDYAVIKSIFEQAIASQNVFVFSENTKIIIPKMDGSAILLRSSALSEDTIFRTTRAEFSEIGVNTALKVDLIRGPLKKVLKKPLT